MTVSWPPRGTGVMPGEDPVKIYVDQGPRPTRMRCARDDPGMSPVIVPIVVGVLAGLVVLGFGGWAMLRGESGLLSDLRRRPDQPDEPAERIALLASTRRELTEAADAEDGLEEMLAWSEDGSSYLALDPASLARLRHRQRAAG